MYSIVKQLTLIQFRQFLRSTSYTESNQFAVYFRLIVLRTSHRPTETCWKTLRKRKGLPPFLNKNYCWILLHQRLYVLHNKKSDSYCMMKWNYLVTFNTNNMFCIIICYGLIVDGIVWRSRCSVIFLPSFRDNPNSLQNVIERCLAQLSPFYSFDHFLL